MKNFIFMLFAGFLATSAFAQYSNDLKDLEQIANFEKEHHRNLSKFVPSKAGNTYNVVYHRLNFEVDPTVYFIKGSVLTFFKPLVSNFTQIQFDLRDGMTVDSVKYHNTNLVSTHQNNIITIILPDTIDLGILDSVTVFYKGSPVDDWENGFYQGDHSGTPIISTLSEPYQARNWWPCKQTLEDKIDSIDIYITNPQQYRAASNGILVDTIISNGKRTSHWKHRHPIATYLVAISVTNYDYYSDYVKIGNDSIEVLNYVYPEDKEAIQSVTPLVAGPMQYFSSQFTPYPFADEKYGHAQFEPNGGMEHQTMTFLGYFSYNIMAHELAHQWFGDYITCGSWHDIWLNEGFATYLTYLTKEDTDSTFFASWRADMIKAVTVVDTGSVYCYDTVSEDRIFDFRLSYLKSAGVLHMLRKKIGKPAFRQGIQNYLNDPALANSFALTPNLQQHLETASGTNLSRFFEDWVYGAGYPKIGISYQYFNNNIQIILKQTPSVETHPNFDFDFTLKLKGYTVDIEYEDTSGDGQIDTLYIFNWEDTLINSHMSSSQMAIVINTSFHVSSIEFDPYHNLIAKVTSYVGIKEPERPVSFIIYPNPSSDFITLDATGNQGVKTIRIFDCIGTEKIILGESQILDKTLLNISGLPNGVYFVQIETQKGNKTVKFIKQ